MSYPVEKIGGGITAPGEIEAAGEHCGLKPGGDKDLALIYCRRPAAAAGMFTTNRFKSPPLLVSEKHLQNPVRAIVINSGVANACTGQQGIDDALATAGAAASELAVGREEVLVFSTGVIGVYLPMEKISRGIGSAAKNLSPRGGGSAAEAIMTTDTVPKEAAYRVRAGGSSFTIGGMAKGSGMICPDVATMLAFITTDVQVERGLLQKALKAAVDRSFNVISVDGDTSPNDAVILLSSGASGLRVEENGPLWDIFVEALTMFCRELACMIVADGEGATKFIELNIKGAPDYDTGRALARAILNSCLVKTAFFGEDANWGRIITALGYAGVYFDPARINVYLGDLQVTENGRGLVFDELKAKEILGQEKINVTVELQIGHEDVTAWGCDLSYDYVTINSSYRG